MLGLVAGHACMHSFIHSFICSFTRVLVDADTDTWVLLSSKASDVRCLS